MNWKPALALAALVLLAGCDRGGDASKAAAERDAEGQATALQEAAMEAKEAVVERIPAVSIREGSALYAKPGDEFLSYLSEGERLIYLGKKENSTVTGRESWSYALVERSDGSLGWTLSDYLAEDTIPGVLLQETALYSQPSAANLIPNERIPIRQIVAVLQAKKFESYYSVRWNVPDTYVVKELYVRQSRVSLQEDDVAAARLMNLAVNDTDLESEIEQLETIVSEFPNSTFIPDVQKAMRYAISRRGKAE